VDVRDATAADYPVFARLFPALEVPDPVPTPEQFEQRMLPHVVVARRGDDALGYAFFRLYGDALHLGHLVTDARARRKGVGRALLEAVRTRARAAGCTRWYLNVKKENVAAIALYSQAGLAREHDAWPFRAEWERLLALPGTRDASGAPLEPADDDALSRFFLGRERLNELRGRAGTVLRVLRSGGEVVAFAAFDPAFPGVYPVAVVSPELAGPMFAALHPHAKHPHVFVTVERDPRLAEVVRGAGAALLFEIMRMGGVLG
jgi:GNAT superfamily N-acetyltransferase